MFARMRILVSAAVGVAFMVCGGFPATSRAAELKCTGCHSAMLRDKVVHNPVASGDCTMCHQAAAGKSHPVDKGSMTLQDQPPKLCYMCHDSMAAKKFVHGPVASGDCLACHDPHKSPNKKLLRAPAGAPLCFMCHDESKFKAKFPHEPVASGDCLDCHDPHQSDYKMMVRKPGSKLCFDCHDESLAKGKSVHPPVAQGKCLDCHMIHGSPYRKMLKKNFPEQFYLPYDPANYALCFGCHNPDIATDKRTDTLTGFRNGDLNLHYVHVHKVEKGRSCKVCHDPHASSQDRLIKTSVPGFGKWDIPIKYTKTPNGGTCVVGCHKPKSYDRIHPVVNP